MCPLCLCEDRVSCKSCCTALNAEAGGKEDVVRLQLSLCRLRMYMYTREQPLTAALSSACQVSPAERQLVTELLALYTPDAVAGQAKLAKGRRAAGPAAEQVLLDVLGLEGGPGQAAGQSIIRLAALTQLAGLYTSLTPSDQQKLLQVLASNLTHSQSDTSVESNMHCLGLL